MRKLARYLKYHLKEALIGPFFKLIEAFTDLINPLFMAKIIDTGIASGNSHYIIKYGIIILALNIVGLICATICQKCASLAAMGVGKKIRSDMYRTINDYSHVELDKFGTPSLVNRLTDDVDQVQSAVSTFIRTIMRSPFLLIGATIMAVTINAKLSLIFIIVMPLVAFILYYIIKKTLPRFKVIRQKLDIVSNVTRENLSGVRVVRAFNKQEFEKERFKDANSKLVRLQLSVGKWSSLLKPLVFLIIDAAIIAIIYLGGIQVNIGALTQGKLIAFVNYLTTIMLSLFELASILVVFIKTTASAHRINAVLETTTSVMEYSTKKVKPDLQAPKIEFKNVTFSYGKQSAPAIENINFKISKGQTLGILGGTASGKTSIINLIARFYDVTEGEVFIDGTNVKDFPTKQLRKMMGIVPQRSNLFAGSLRDNMRMGKKNATDEEILEALEIAQADFVKNWTNPLDYKIMAGGKNVSGGQRQRLTIARALVAKPEILILDDSSSALDYLTDAKLRRALKQLECTTILVSQRATSVKSADLIIVLEYGKIVGAGKHDYLMNNCTVYKDMYDSQTKLHGAKYEKK